MLAWNYNAEFEMILGFGLKSVTVEYSSDGAEWISLGDAELAQGTGRSDYAANMVVDLQGGRTLCPVDRQQRLWHAGPGRPQRGSFPLHSSPSPAADAIEVAIDTVLNWRAGREAATHEVYLARRCRHRYAAGLPYPGRRRILCPVM